MQRFAEEERRLKDADGVALPAAHPELRLDEAVAILERTPGTLRALLSGLPDRWLSATEGKGTWSPYEVVGHLVQAEKSNWIPRARQILAGDTRPFAPFDRTAHLRASRGRPLDELLADFAEARDESLQVLREMRLSIHDLSRTGRHPEFGEVTLSQLLGTWVVHDLGHLGQIVRTMAKAYGEVVGPWRAYLSILR